MNDLFDWYRKEKSARIRGSYLHFGKGLVEEKAKYEQYPQSPVEFNEAVFVFAECILFRGGPVRRRRIVIIIKRVMNSKCVECKKTKTE